MILIITETILTKKATKSMIFVLSIDIALKKLRNPLCEKWLFKGLNKTYINRFFDFEYNASNSKIMNIFSRP